MKEQMIAIPAWLDERGHTWLTSEDGTAHAAWFKLYDGRFLSVTVEPENYPGFCVGISAKSEREIADHINENLQGWHVRVCNLAGVRVENDEVSCLDEPPHTVSTPPLLCPRCDQPWKTLYGNNLPDVPNDNFRGIYCEECGNPLPGTDRANTAESLLAQPEGMTMKVDVFLGTGVCVEVPSGTDLDSEDGYLLVKEAARARFLELLRNEDFDVEAERYAGDGYVYSYTTADGTPALRCPACGQDWTEPAGILLQLSVGGVTLEVRTHLNGDAVLQDTDDQAVARGLHSGTHCGGCREWLPGLNGVQEVGG